MVGCITGSTRQSEMADLTRRATRWVGTLSDGNVHVKFHDDRLRNGGDNTYWNFMETRFGDLRPWPLILKIFVSHRVPILNVYVKFHDDRLRNDWDYYTLKFCENTDKTRTNTHTNTQTNRHGHYNTSPSPYGGRGIYCVNRCMKSEVIALTSFMTDGRMDGRTDARLAFLCPPPMVSPWRGTIILGIFF